MRGNISSGNYVTRKRKRGAVLNEAVARKIHTVLALSPELIKGCLI